MRERPIILTGESVRASLAGRKTQTRRALREPQPLDLLPMPGQEGRRWVTLLHRGERPPVGNRGGVAACRYGEPGDRLWVRESFSWSRHWDPAWHDETGETRDVWYWADGDPEDGDWTRPQSPILMPRGIARLVLEIVDVRVERVQTISQADAIAEGVYEAFADEREAAFSVAPPGESSFPTPRAYFERLWDSINAKRGLGWDRNPWVWAITYRVLEPADRTQPVNHNENAAVHSGGALSEVAP